MLKENLIKNGRLYLYEFGFYCDYIQIYINEKNQPILKNTVTGELLKGFPKIERYIELRNSLKKGYVELKTF